MQKRSNHELFVDEWVLQRTKNLSKAEIISIFRSGTQAIWYRAHLTLSEITLSPIFDRVLHGANHHYPWLGDVDVNEQGYNFGNLDIKDIPVEHLIMGLKTMLLDLLTVLGNLTAEALTKPIYKELAQVSMAIVEPESRPANISAGPNGEFKKGT